jgi:hypothetical protein
VDGDAGSRWESGRTDSEWLQVDLGARHDLSRVQIDWENAGAAEYTVQVADTAAGPWTTLKRVTKTAARPDDLAVEGTGRFLRITGVKRLTQYGYSIFGLRAYGTVNAAAVKRTHVLVSPQQRHCRRRAPREADRLRVRRQRERRPHPRPTWDRDGEAPSMLAGSFSADHQEGGPYRRPQPWALLRTAAVSCRTSKGVVRSRAPEPTPETDDRNPPWADTLPRRLTEERRIRQGRIRVLLQRTWNRLEASPDDGKLSTRWSSQFTDNEWIEVDLGSVLPITSVGLAWENAYGTAFTLQTRNSASEPWRTIATEAAGTGGDASYRADTSGRYVRMLGSKRSSPYGYSLHEIRIFSTEGTS